MNPTNIGGELTELIDHAQGAPLSATRVLFVDHTAAMSGGEIALLNLLRFLDPEKVKPVVVLGAEGPLAERLRAIALAGAAQNGSQEGKAASSLLGQGWAAAIFESGSVPPESSHKNRCGTCPKRRQRKRMQDRAGVSRLFSLPFFWNSKAQSTVSS